MATEKPAKKPVNAYKYKADQKKRESGILVEVDCSGDYPQGRVVKEVGELLTFLVANATDQNPAFEKAYEANCAEYREARDAKSKTEAELGAMLSQAFDKTFAEVCVLGWYNQLDENDDPWPFSKEAVTKFFLEVPEVYASVWPKAQDRRNFRIERPGSVEVDAKNS